MTILLLLTILSAGEPYQWPLNLPPAVTSSFGEYRAGRFHAGLDLRTVRVGPEVYAGADGYVSRIRCSPWGYGKAVYLRAKDGNTLVYAHLADFSSSLREYVQRAQHSRESYTVDLVPEPNEFPVRRGELLAFAGRSGSRAPHLHWELRDEASRPINPRLLGLSWPDDTRPVFRKVLVVPKGPGSSVNGDMVPVVLDVGPEGAPGVYRCASITATGQIGIAVDVIDPANQNSNVLGVHILRTAVDGREVFRVQNDRLSYETMSDGAVSWHPYYVSEGRFLLQWRWTGNESDNFAVSDGDGWLDAGGRPLDVLIEAQDFFGNTATLPIQIEPGGPEAPAPASRGSDAPGVVSVDCFDRWLLVTARFPDAEPEPPVLECTGLEPGTGVLFQRVGEGLFRAAVQAGAHTNQVTLAIQHPRLEPYAETLDVFQRGRGGVARVGELVIRADAQSAYGTFFVRVSEQDVTPSPDLVSVGKGYRLWPGDAPVDAPLEISFPQPAGDAELSKVSLYRKSGSGWTRQETERTGGRLTIRTSSLGIFAPMADVVAPTITGVVPAADSAPATNRRPEIRARVADNASGVSDIRVSANGKWLLAEFDPFDSPAATVTWLRDEDLPFGENHIVIRVTDAVGNVSEVSRAIHIIEDPAAAS